MSWNMSSGNHKNVAIERKLPFLNDHLPEEYQKKACEELNETPRNSLRLLQDLRHLAKKENITKEYDFHDDLLRQFLRQSKYDVQRALKRLQVFVNFRTKNPEVFKPVNPEQISKSSDYRYCTPLPWRCQDGCTIMIFDHSKWDPNTIPFDDLIRLGLVVCQQSLRNPLTQINGIKMIVDWKDCRLRQLKYMTPLRLFMVYQAYMDCTPARNKEIHMVNESIVMRMMWPILKPFLSAKLRNRIIFHSSLTSLLNYFPIHSLPAQYGGDLEDYYMEDWMKEANEQQKLSTLRGQCNLF